MIVALYCDGGVIGRNPSKFGGTWAWCAVDETGARVIERSDRIDCRPFQLITNNHTEQIAISEHNAWCDRACTQQAKNKA